ncbi:MAG TPA: hypothetical protein VIO56_06615 [Methylotenera sp.]
MQVAINDLENAFKASKLPLMGYTFEAAISNQALAICLKHLAQRKTPLTPVKPVREYWFNKI